MKKKKETPKKKAAPKKKKTPKKKNTPKQKKQQKKAAAPAASVVRSMKDFLTPYDMLWSQAWN